MQKKNFVIEEYNGNGQSTSLFWKAVNNLNYADERQRSKRTWYLKNYFTYYIVT